MMQGDQELKVNEIEETTKEKDVKYKTKESDGLDNANAESFNSSFQDSLSHQLLAERRLGRCREGH